MGILFATQTLLPFVEEALGKVPSKHRAISKRRGRFRVRTPTVESLLFEVMIGMVG